MKKLFAFLYLAFFWSTIVLPQTSSDTLQSKYSSYFRLSREAIFIHVNKTIFVRGENVWFTVHVYDRKENKPSLATSNLVCRLYDSEGKQLAEKLLLVEKGQTQGFFKLDKSFAKGEFFIVAGTNWMKNFKEEGPAIRRISILGDGEEKINYTGSRQYEVELMPEGGHLLSEAYNTIGFRVTDKDGKGHSIKNGYIVDNFGEKNIVSITNTKFGIGKFRFRLSKSKDYMIRFVLENGTTISKKIPAPKEIGIALSVNNLPKNKVAIGLSTNSNTLPLIEGKEYYLALHRDGLFNLSTFKLESTEKTINLSKEDLLPGINILTIFDNQLRPIAERLVFNQNNLKLGKVAVDIDNFEPSGDSVRIKLNLYSKKYTPTNISLSVHPEATMAYNDGNSILSEFLLKPYLKRDIHYPAYYFRSIDRRKLFELDLLLLTEGWSKYDWKDIFEGPPETRHPREKGITVRGKVRNADYGKKNTIVFYQKKSGNLNFGDIDANKDFIVKSVPVFSNDSIYFSLLGEKGKAKIPDIEATFFGNMEEFGLLDWPSEIPDYPGMASSSQKSQNTQLQTDLFEKGTIGLKNVTVIKKVEKVLKRNSMLKAGIYEGEKVSISDVKQSPTLAQYLRKLGFRVRINPTDGTGVILPKTRSPLIQIPKVVLDDVILVDVTKELFNMPAGLLNSSTDLIDEVYYEHFGVEGSNGGTVYIYRRYGSTVSQNAVDTFTSMLATEGFQRPIEYYAPEYSSYNTQDFFEYGFVHWEGKMEVDENGICYVDVPHYNLKGLKLFIEGMGQDGTFYSLSKLLPLP